MLRNILIGIGIFVLLGLGIWMAKSKSEISSPELPWSTDGNQATTTGTSGSNVTPGSQGGSKPASVPNVTKNSFTYILTRAGNYECFYDALDGNVQHNNRLYISGGKMHGEFRSTAGPTSMMTYDGSYLYSWQEGQVSGTRARLTSISQLPGAIPKDLTSGAIYGTSGENVSWDCHTWITDAKMLSAPTYVKFQ